MKYDILETTVGIIEEFTLNSPKSHAVCLDLIEDAILLADGGVQPAEADRDFYRAYAVPTLPGADVFCQVEISPANRYSCSCGDVPFCSHIIACIIIDQRELLAGWSGADTDEAKVTRKWIALFDDFEEATDDSHEL